jgi:hypothetical protein
VTFAGALAREHSRARDVQRARDFMREGCGGANHEFAAPGDKYVAQKCRKCHMVKPMGATVDALIRAGSEGAKVDDKPTTTDQPCKQCHRSVSPGDARCWFCTTPDPAPIQTTDDPDWSSSLMRVAVPGPSGGSVGYMSFGSTHVPYPIAPPTSQPYSLTLTDKSEGAELANALLGTAADELNQPFSQIDLDTVLRFLDRAREIVRGLK